MQRTAHKQASWIVPCTRPGRPAEHNYNDDILRRSDVFLCTSTYCLPSLLAVAEPGSCPCLWGGSGTTTHKHCRPASQQAGVLFRIIAVFFFFYLRQRWPLGWMTAKDARIKGRGCAFTGKERHKNSGRSKIENREKSACARAFASFPSFSFFSSTPCMVIDGQGHKGRVKLWPLSFYFPCSYFRRFFSSYFGLQALPLLTRPCSALLFPVLPVFSVFPVRTLACWLVGHRRQ